MEIVKSPSPDKGERNMAKMSSLNHLRMLDRIRKNRSTPLDLTTARDSSAGSANQTITVSRLEKTEDDTGIFTTNDSQRQIPIKTMNSKSSKIAVVYNPKE